MHYGPVAVAELHTRMLIGDDICRAQYDRDYCDRSVARGTRDGDSVIITIRVTDSNADGIFLGAMAAVLPAALVGFGQCLNSCTLLYPFTPAGWGIIAGGAAIGASIDAAVLRTAYRGGDAVRLARSRLTPVITASPHAVQASWRF